MFPIQAPQYVIVVRLVDPTASIYGGTVAGRVVNTILQQAVAARDVALDRRSLAAVAHTAPTPVAKPVAPAVAQAARRDSARFDSLRATPAPTPTAVTAPAFVVVRVSDSARTPTPTRRRLVKAVPSVYGLDTRQATLVLHTAGFRVSLASGDGARTRPAAGALAREGSVVVLEVPRP
jgi:hypothetical protein